ncbi:MAG: pyruvate kinase [Methyloligellaceae bacterium]
MRRDRRAKIVATLGPASSSKDVIKELFLAGVDVFRLNFSHGTHDDHAKTYGIIREIENELNRKIGILQDLQGPKIRVGAIEGGKITVNKGDIVRFVPGKEKGGITNVPLPHPEIFEKIMPQHKLYIDDGRLRLTVQKFGDDFIEAHVDVGGVLSDRKGVNLPDTVLNMSPITEKDMADLEFGLNLGVDWVALSFVQKPDDIIEAKRLIRDRAALVAKIEKPSALEHMEDIIRLSDAVMVARGDLGVEIPPEEVPGRQKELIRACRKVAKPVIVATQMLDSMAYSPAPTRAEASDVATAIYDGADAVMLSAESATGDYPVEAVAMMNRIIRKTENHHTYRSIIDALEPNLEKTVHHSVSEAAADIANAIDAAVIVAFTSSGTTALRIARKRPKVQIISLTPNEQTAHKLSLLWGAHSVSTNGGSSDYSDMIKLAKKCAREEGFADTGDKVVVICGFPFGKSGTTNNIRVVEM